MGLEAYETAADELVTISGLSKRQDLNGKQAIVKKFLDDSCRYQLEICITAEVVAVRPDNLDLRESTSACARKLAIEYLTQAMRVGSDVLALTQSFEKMGDLNGCVLLARHASFYVPSCADAQACCGFFLYQRGMVADALYEMASACSKPSQKWLTPHSQDIKNMILPLLERSRPLLLRGSWTEVEASGPEGRFFPAYCQHGQMLYVFGGEGKAKQILGDLWALDMGALQWTPMSISTGSKDFQRTRAAMWFHNGKLYVHGGKGPEGESHPDLHRFENGSWHRVKTKGDGPSPRSEHAGFCIGDVAYVWGGLAGDVAIYMLDLKKFKWARRYKVGSQSPSARGHFMWWFDADPARPLLWMRGGQDLDILANQSTLDIASGAKACTSFRENDSRIENGIWRCDLLTARWERVEEDGFPPPPMNELSCAQAASGPRWAFGGYWDGWNYPTVSANDDGTPSANNLTSYYYKNLYVNVEGFWRLVVDTGPTAPARCAGAAMAALPGGNGVVIFGGYTTLNSSGTMFSKRGRCKVSDKTLVCRVPLNSAFEIVPDREPIVSTESSRDEIEGEDSVMGTDWVKFNRDEWLEACRQVVKGDLELRRRFSEKAYRAFEKHGPGALVGLYSFHGKALATDMMHPDRFDYWVPATAADGVSAFVHGRFCNIFHSMVDGTKHDFLVGFLTIMLPDFEGFASNEFAESVFVWSSAMQGFSFGYCGAGILAGMNIQSYEDQPGRGSTEDIRKVEAAMHAVDIADNFESMGTMDRCARPGCLSVSEASLMRSLKQIGGRACEKVKVPNGITVATFQFCGKCKSVQYCGRKCQLADWERHKVSCKSLAAQRAAGGVDYLVSTRAR